MNCPTVITANCPRDVNIFREPLLDLIRRMQGGNGSALLQVRWSWKRSRCGALDMPNSVTPNTMIASKPRDASI